MSWHVLMNPYFLGYILLVLLLVCFGNMLKRAHQQNLAEREAKRVVRRRIVTRRLPKRLRVTR